jgi:hypothetical protein
MVGIYAHPDNKMTNEEKFVLCFVLVLLLGGKWFFGPQKCSACDGRGMYGGYQCQGCGGRGFRQ